MQMANPSKMNSHRQDDYASENYLRRIKAEIRKTNKPIMEKKRRARINNYLNDLKSLLLDAMKKDPVRHSKLEKADILDLTVKHLQDIERRRLAVAMAVDPSVPEKFASGYRECIDEIVKYFDTLGTVDEGLKGRVRKHLESCLTFPGKAAPFPGGVGAFGGVPLSSPDDINNNTQGLLNRVFANNLSLGIFPSAGMGFLGDLSAAVPFNPFPFFGPLRGVPSGTLPGHGGFPASLDQEVPELKREATPRDKEPSQRSHPVNPVVPSPPASPRPPSEADDSGTTLMTPVGKTGTASEQHTMERLLAIFPTPPSPEDPQPTQRRFGKLGHHFGASPFVPTGRSLGDETPDTSREEGGPSSDTSSREPNREQPDGDEGKDNPNGEMWRPW